MTIKLFSSNDGVVRLEVSLDQDTAWLTQSQMEEFFGDRSVISRHINNVFKEGELPRESSLLVGCHYFGQLSCEVPKRRTIPPKGHKYLKRTPWLPGAIDR